MIYRIFMMINVIMKVIRKIKIIKTSEKKEDIQRIKKLNFIKRKIQNIKKKRK